MSENSNNDDDLNDNHGNTILPKEKGERISSYSIEVCQGPDCTGLGGGVAVLEIEELVREHIYQKGGDNLRVIAGGCRDFCSVGPNVHIHQKSGRKKTILLESFQNVRDASSCDRVVSHATAQSSSDHPTDEDATNRNPPASSVGSMMARRAERIRWEALKDVSRTIAKSKKTAADGGDTVMKRKLRVWKETCTDRIERLATANQLSQREKRRMDTLVQIASDRLDRICLQVDDVSDSSSYGSSDDSESSGD